MKTVFKKVVAVIATAMISTSIGMLGVGAFASDNSVNFEDLTAADDDSIFTWSNDGIYAKVCLENTSGSSRYAQVNAYGYDARGYYVDHIVNEGVIADGEEICTSGNLPGAKSITFEGTLYSGTQPVGTPLSHWTRSADV